MTAFDNVLKKGDNMLKKGKELAGTVAKGSVSAANLTKLTIKKNEFESSLKKTYASLGEKIIRCAVEGEDYQQYVEQAVAEVAALKARIAELNDEILEVQKKVKCPNCGQINSVDASFCPKCGAKIPEPVREEADAEPIEEKTEE